ncbi:ABC transporter ATP-binding protein [Sporolactobacillus sp. STCC-11]|uniref:ABC transporter ATP-binding protein n=1 Tax=Sporolactobacillus caesalpiniae TaxID=3230362 RepID=UPI0033992761
MIKVKTLIEVKNVSKEYGKKKGGFKAVNNISLSICQGEILGLVGESGSGKSTLGKMLIGLEQPTDGTIYYRGHPLWNRNGKFNRPESGECQIVFQDPQSSLDPRMKIKSIIQEPLSGIRHRKNGKQSLFELIKNVGLKEDQLNRLPNEFSGGQRQRIAIARALITHPSFLILDEPTSALDVSVQAQILNLLKSLKKDKQLTYLFISHNMSVIRYMCDRVAVMYKGQIVEKGGVQELFHHPKHPYTKILLSTLPSVHTVKQMELKFAEPATSIPDSSCVFYDRCPFRKKICLHAPESRRADQESHYFSCHFSL